MFNFGKFTPGLLDSNNPSIGINNPKVSMNNGFIICSFSRDRAKSLNNYFDLNKSHFLLAAFGAVGPSGGKNFNKIL
jgi:hypothetical protein